MSDESDLPPGLQDLEARLKKVPPAPLSQALHARLAAIPRAQRPRILPWLMTAAALLVSTVTTYWLLSQPPTVSDHLTHVDPVKPVKPMLNENSPPTLLVYMQAAEQSPEELDRLLALHDRKLLQHNPQLEMNF